MLQEITEALQSTLNNMIQGLADFIPKFLSGLIIFVTGYLIARLIRTLVTRVGYRLGLDGILDRAGLTDRLKSAGIRKSPSELLGLLLYYVILLNFLLASLKSMGLNEAVEPLEKMVDFLPTALAGMITLIVGVLLAQLIGRTVSTALQSVGIEFHQTLGNAVQMIVLGVVVVVVMEQIGLEASVLTTILTGTIIMIIGGLALAFGLGGQNVTRNVLAGFYARELFAAGDVVVLNGEEGIVEGIGTLNSEIRIGADLLTVPNTRLTEGEVRKRE